VFSFQRCLAVAVGGRKTKKEAVTEALREYIARRRQAQIARLFGTVEYDPKYDYKKQRRGLLRSTRSS
jgi:hypothetical protein